MQFYLLNPYFRRVVLAVVLDALCLLVAAAATWQVLSLPFSPEIYWGATGVLVAACFVALYYCDAYRPSVLGSGRDTLACVGNAMGLAFLSALVVYFAVPAPPGVVPALAQTAAIYFPLLLAERLAFRAVSSLPRFNHRVVMVGVSELSLAIADAIRQRKKMGTELVGFLSDDVDHQGGQIAGFPFLGRVHEIEKVVHDHRIGRIVVASKSRSEYFPAEELLSAKLRGRRVESGIAFFERISGRIYLNDLRPSYLIFSEGFYSGLLSQGMKRLVDIVGSLAALCLAAPVIGLCGLAIRLDSKGPVFYRQERVGRDGELFMVLKLRSMRQDAEKETGAVFANLEDRRVTRVGRFLRRTRLDEVPQLWNVFTGEMSLVGPRPERPEFVEELSARHPYFRLRSALKPGITGWAQIRHGYVNEMEAFGEKLALDLYYMKWRSLPMDLLILWHTVKTVILFRGV